MLNVNFKLMLLENISWISGVVIGGFITFAQLGQSLLSIITAVLVTVATFLMKELMKKWFKQETKKEE